MHHLLAGSVVVHPVETVRAPTGVDRDLQASNYLGILAQDGQAEQKSMGVFSVAAGIAGKCSGDRSEPLDVAEGRIGSAAAHWDL